ncbi:hypothetical protein [Pelagibacterium luteolum]|uniref:Uncharacterized protein n=1 Tax=Pelagibacterium luteolum TaxID=440168 RepID=A0A1G7XHT9_9HYPH|nr:hypothetical protein [Pelagibacterium luteolum]SDG83845.1 hypothetical protein SAMN04487974_109131 [Pelagibacterium luteolum]
MSGPRDYSITIRNEAETYIGKGVEDRNYAKVSSSEAQGDEGVITLQLGRGQSITLKAHEAIDIGQTLARAGHGARKVTPAEEKMAKNLNGIGDALKDAVTSLGKAMRHAEEMAKPVPGATIPGPTLSTMEMEMPPISPEQLKAMRMKRSRS